MTSVSIPNSVTSIGEDAFLECSGLTSVSIGNSVTSIGDEAFAFCSGLTSVSIGNSVTSIGDEAFAFCSGLTSVSIPNSVTSIGYGAFSFCSGLTSISIPNSVNSIGEYAFSECSGLTSVISKAVTPPTCDSDVFDTYSIPIIVPSIAKEAYQAASIWSNFSNYAEPDNKITAIAINNNEANLIIDNTLQLSATVSPEDATFADVLQWSSSNPEVATVDDNGLVTAIAKGDAEIIATTCDGSNLSASYTIKVYRSNDEALAALNALVANAETLYNNSVEGDNIGDYTPGARAELFASIESVKSKISESMSADEITACTNEINAAIQLFESKKVTTTASALSFEVDGIYYNKNGDGTVSVTYRGNSFFDYPDEYTGDVTIPTSVTYSGTTYSVTSIGSEAFQGCSGLTSVTIPNSVTSIDYDAFSACSGLTSVSIPNSVTSIGNSAFRYCVGLTSVTILNSVTSIGSEAFAYCYVLKSVNIPNSVNSIGNSAFCVCHELTSITIPNSVTSIGDDAFRGCSGLESIVVESGNSKYDSRDNCNAIIETATNTLLAGCKNTTIPNSVTEIGNGAFEDCRGLTSITIPNSVTEIGNSAFLRCSGLTSVTIPNSVTSIGNEALRLCSGLESIVVESGNSKYDSRDNCNAIIETATNTLLAGCKNTTIPNSVTSIGEAAFWGCSGLTSVTIPNSVTSIGSHAFAYSCGLTSVTIPNSVAAIGNWAFSGCSGLESIVVESGNSKYDSRDNCNAIIETATNTLLAGCKNTTIPNTVTSIGEAAFQGCSGLTSVTIPNSVTSIGYYAFQGCSGLTSVTIPNSVTSIGDAAFQDCSSLTSITIPNSVNSIGYCAFGYCSGLTSITIGNSVTSIGSNAFQSCSRLTSVTSKAVTPPTCDSDVFDMGTYSKPIIVPSIAKEAYKAASIWSNFSNYVETDNKITAIAINNNEANLVIGNSLQLSATVSPEDATFADVLQWSSSNPEVATVDDNGLVTAITKGDSEIIATTCDGSNLSTSCIIKVLESNDEALAALNALVANAETLYNNSVEGDRIGDYTPGARAELFASIENVKSKISESMSADEITACTNEINAAIQLFESKMVTTSEDTDVSLHENIIFVENAEAFVGKSVTLSLKMNNTIVPVGFQCDFYAPSKTSVPTDEDGFYAIDLSTERTTASRHNIFESGLQKDGGIRILAASTRNYPFAGNEGEVITITLNVDADLEEGEYPLILRNVIISDAQSNTYSVDYVKSTLTVSDYTPGDVNGDGSINIGDVTAVVSHIMGAETNVFIEKAADVTGDGSVNIGDLTGIVGMIIGGNSLAPATKAATKAIASPKTSDISGYDNVIYAKDVTFGEDGRATLSINMKNSVVTPGFQFDIVMPEGIEIEKDEIGYIIELSTERTTTRKTNIFESGLQKDGSVRVLAASTKNTPFEGNDGEVCTVSLILGEGTAPGEYEVVLKNIIISDPKGVTYSVDKTTAIITVPGSINEAANVNELVSGANNVGFGLQGVKMHDGVLYACTTTESVNKSTPTLHGNAPDNMDTYEDRNFAAFDQRDWVAISGLEGEFEGKELSYPFVATFANGVLTPSETITKVDAKDYKLNTFRAENILHGGYSNYAEGNYKAYYVPARVNEVAYFMGLIKTDGKVKYLYSNNAYGREGIKIENCTIADNSKSYSLLEGILVADASTKAGVKIIMLQALEQATGVEGVDTAAGRIYTANGNIIIAATEDGEAAVYDFTGCLIKSVPVASGNSTAVPVMPGCYIVKTETKTQSVVVK